MRAHPQPYADRYQAGANESCDPFPCRRHFLRFHFIFCSSRLQPVGDEYAYDLLRLCDGASSEVVVAHRLIGVVEAAPCFMHLARRDHDGESPRTAPIAGRHVLERETEPVTAIPVADDGLLVRTVIDPDEIGDGLRSQLCRVDHGNPASRRHALQSAFSWP